MYLSLFILWLVFNGRVTLEVCILGIVVTGAVFAFFCLFLDHSIQKEKRVYRNAGYMFLYALTLIEEVIKANINVLKVVLNRNIPIQQTVVRVHVELKSDLARVILANSITLTPGTITVAVKDSEFTIHCLSREMSDGIEESRFVTLLQKMEG